MQVYYPEYYRDFRCVAADCPDSCCKEWMVDVDEASAQYYRGLTGPLGDRLRQVLRDTEDGTVMEIENGRCPMWREDGLCRIQAQLGHDALCKTCREFPRLCHDYGDFVELGLELSCPEAARLILTSGCEMRTEQRSGGEEPDYEPEVMEILRSSRTEILDFLADENYSVPEALTVLLLHGYAVQSRLDGGEGEPLNPEKCLADAKEYAATGDVAAFVGFFRELEILTDLWRKRLEKPAAAPCWGKPLRAMARYMIHRYWLQAVSDYDLVCRVKLTVAGCLLVAILGGDPLQTAQLFSKEIENNPDNVEAILDGAYAAKALTDLNLLGLLRD